MINWIDCIKQPEHAGTYHCEAVGYSSATSGSRVSVYLKVDPCKFYPFQSNWLEQLTACFAVTNNITLLSFNDIWLHQPNAKDEQILKEE